MNLLYFVLGSLLLLLVIVDLLWTTVWVEQGAGPLTSRLMSWTWNSIRKMASTNSIVLTLSGPLILILGLSIWLSFLWVGWTLIFASVEGALVDTVSSRLISWPELLYFTGYTVFTLGNGDFIPSGPVWQLATVLATASGMLFVTLSVTYVLSVLGAVTQKRSFARGVHGLGTESTAILRTSWDGNSFQGLDVPLNTLATELNALTSNHKAYPILHYFYSEQREQAPTSGITILDEALTLLRFGVSEQKRPNEMLLLQTRSSVDGYLDTVGGAYVEPANRSPPRPDIEELRDAGIPTVSDEEFATSVEELDERRRTLLGLIESDERQWPTTDPPQGNQSDT